MFLFSMDRRGRFKKQRFQTHPELIDHLMREHQYVRMTTPVRGDCPTNANMKIDLWDSLGSYKKNHFDIINSRQLCSALYSRSNRAVIRNKEKEKVNMRTCQTRITRWPSKYIFLLFVKVLNFIQSFFLQVFQILRQEEVNY